MYKIKYIPTGHIFELPDIVAKDLKSKFPDDYQILEKNGKKVRDTVKKKVKGRRLDRSFRMHVSEEIYKNVLEEFNRLEK